MSKCHLSHIISNKKDGRRKTSLINYNSKISISFVSIISLLEKLLVISSNVISSSFEKSFISEYCSLKNEFNELSKMPSLWTRSFYVSTAENAYNEK